MQQMNDSKIIIIIYICLLYILISIPFNLQGSNNLEGSSKTITFHFDQVLLKNALEYLIKNYEIPIAYQDDQIKGIKISAKCDKCMIKDALQVILRDTEFTWKKVGNQYIISLQKEKISGNRIDT